MCYYITVVRSRSGRTNGDFLRDSKSRGVAPVRSSSPLPSAPLLSKPRLGRGFVLCIGQNDDGVFWPPSGKGDKLGKMERLGKPFFPP